MNHAFINHLYFLYSCGVQIVPSTYESAVHTLYSLFIHRTSTKTISTTRRVLTYVGPVAFAAVAFNIPKFIENEIHTDANGTSQIQIADRRIQHDYMLYYTFSLIAHPTLTTGIAPMVALIFMNIKIFQGKHIGYIFSSNYNVHKNSYGLAF